MPHSEKFIFDWYSILQSSANILLVIAIAYFLNLIIEKAIVYFAHKTKFKLDELLLTRLRLPLFLTIVLIGVYWGVAPVVASQESLTKYRLYLFTFVVLIWSLGGIRIVDVLFLTLTRKTGRTHGSSFNSIIPLLTNVVKIGLLIGAVGVALRLWGVDVKPLIASAGIVGAGLAFAAKDTISNLFGGVSVFFDKPYKIGDYIYVSGEYRGEVIEIGMRSTKIRTRDNILLTVPNSVMVTNVVVNETGFDPKLRVRIPLEVSYVSDLKKVEEVLLDVAAKDPHILEHPGPRIRYREFGESGVKLEMMGMITRPSDRGKIVHEIIKAIHTRFKSEHITIPFPQRDVHIASDVSRESIDR